MILNVTRKGRKDGSFYISFFSVLHVFPVDAHSAYLPNVFSIVLPPFVLISSPEDELFVREKYKNRQKRKCVADNQNRSLILLSFLQSTGKLRSLISCACFIFRPGPLCAHWHTKSNESACVGNLS